MTWLLGLWSGLKLLSRGIWKYLVIAVLSGALVFAYMMGSRKTSVLKERIKQRKKVQDNVEKAKRGRDRIRSDPSERDRLRKRRTRD